MNKLICLLALASLSLGCETAKTTTTKTKNQPPAPPVINTISCEMRGEWVDFRTYQSVFSSVSAVRHSIWRFKTVEGQQVTATNCSSYDK